MGAPIVDISAACKAYGRGAITIYALRNVDLRIDAGEFVTIVGPSGSGKSTCLNLIGCLDIPTSGTVRLAGHDLVKLDPDARARVRRDHVGFIFQGANLISRMSALRNVELPLVYRGVAARDRRRRATAALTAVGLTNRMHHSPMELSGGQQQRVAIARAIVSHPRLIIADEPTGALDSFNGRAVLALLEKLNRELGIAVVMVTHDGAVAEQSPRLVTFRDGHLVGDEVRKGRHHAH